MTLRSIRRRAASYGLAAATLALLIPGEAGAAGLYFSDRGVRPLGRAGAFVAGADDLGAIYYNPAGLIDARTQFLFDASWLRFSADYTRQSIVTARDPNTGATGASYVQTFESVHGSSPILPIPTLAGSYAITKDIVVAGGIYAPYAAITSYPERDSKGNPAAQRYSLITLDGSALSVLGAFVAWRPIPELQVGAGPTVLVGNFQSTVAFGACPPDRLACAPEQPDFDAQGQLKVGTIVAPSGTLGATILPTDKVRIGTSFQLPYWIDAPAQFKTRLPSSGLFQNATVDGQDARVKFTLPWVLRAGVEVRPQDTTRVEVAFVYEKWSMHDRIDVTPDNVYLRNVSIFPDYRIGNLSIQRNFQDAWSIRVGGEQSFKVGQYVLDARAGIAYEKSAVPPEQLSVLTVDMNKVTLGLGGGLHLGKKLRLDGVLAFVFPSSVDVDPNTAAQHKINPIRANGPGADPAINGGHYSAAANVLGFGLRYQFDAEDGPPPPPANTPPSE
jgi:long-chain fatty acid transport protein